MKNNYWPAYEMGLNPPEKVQGPTKKNMDILFANVFFGSPLRKCSGHGICELRPIKSIAEINLNWKPCGGFAALSIPAEGILKIQLLKFTLSNQIFFKQFSGNQFTMEEDYFLSVPNSSFRSMLLKRGGYQVVDNEEFMVMEIPFLRQ